jgi:hypothetical protein
MADFQFLKFKNEENAIIKFYVNTPIQAKTHLDT